MIGDGKILAAGLMPESTGQPALAYAGRPDEEQAMVLPDPVATGQLEEAIAVEAEGRGRNKICSKSCAYVERIVNPRLEPA